MKKNTEIVIRGQIPSPRIRLKYGTVSNVTELVGVLNDAAFDVLSERIEDLLMAFGKEDGNKLSVDLSGHELVLSDRRVVGLTLSEDGQMTVSVRKDDGSVEILDTDEFNAVFMINICRRVEDRFNVRGKKRFTNDIFSRKDRAMAELTESLRTIFATVSLFVDDEDFLEAFANINESCINNPDDLEVSIPVLSRGHFS